MKSDEERTAWHTLLMENSTNYARQLRRHLTPQERRLWHQLRHRRFASYKFRRQHPAGPYIQDSAW